MNEAALYLSAIKTRLALSSCVAQVEVVAEHRIQDRGYFRARLVLMNGDFLEVSEYFVIRGNETATLEYRYQWMDPKKQKLIRRWDNARHFPGLAQFPDHVHLADEKQVVPGRKLSILDLIGLIEQELVVGQP